MDINGLKTPEESIQGLIDSTSEQFLNVVLSSSWIISIFLGCPGQRRIIYNFETETWSIRTPATNPAVVEEDIASAIEQIWERESCIAAANTETAKTAHDGAVQAEQL